MRKNELTQKRWLISDNRQAFLPQQIFNIRIRFYYQQLFHDIIKLSIRGYFYVS